jgi:ankyrin repeat protein
MPKNESRELHAKSPDFGNDDDFNEMLAEVTAADSVLSANTPASIDRTANAASSSSRSTSRRLEATSPVIQVSDNEILSACKRGDITQLRRWGREGVRVQNLEKCVYLPAILANLHIIRCLVNELGADVNSTTSDGVTALLVAAQGGHIALVRCLVRELGADVNRGDAFWCTALFIAAQHGHLAVVRCLLQEHGADANQANINGTPPLLIAAEVGHLDVLRCLVKEHGADVNQANKKGCTPLVFAASYDHLAVVRCLVKEFGADVNKKSQFGLTPPMVASRYEHEGVLAFLIKYGANTQSFIHASGIAATAADISRTYAGQSEQTKYLEARTHCANTGCDGAGAQNRLLESILL